MIRYQQRLLSLEKLINELSGTADPTVVEATTTPAGTSYRFPFDASTTSKKPQCRKRKRIYCKEACAISSSFPDSDGKGVVLDYHAPMREPLI